MYYCCIVYVLLVYKRRIFNKNNICPKIKFSESGKRLWTNIVCMRLSKPVSFLFLFKLNVSQCLGYRYRLEQYCQQVFSSKQLITTFSFSRISYKCCFCSALSNLLRIFCEIRALIKRIYLNFLKSPFLIVSIFCATMKLYFLCCVTLNFCKSTSFF